MSEDPLIFVDMSGGRLTCYKYSIICQDDLLTVDNAQSHVTAFRPISEATRCWSDDNCSFHQLWTVLTLEMAMGTMLLH